MFTFTGILKLKQCALIPSLHLDHDRQTFVTASSMATANYRASPRALLAAPSQTQQL